MYNKFKNTCGVRDPSNSTDILSKGVRSFSRDGKPVTGLQNWRTEHPPANQRA